MIIALWLVFAVLVAVLAANRGHNAFLAFLTSVLLSPLIGLIIVLCLKDKKAALQAEAAAARGVTRLAALIARERARTA